MGGKPEQPFIQLHINDIYKEEVGSRGVRSRVLGDLSSEGTVLLPPLTLPPLPLWVWQLSHAVGARNTEGKKKRKEIRKG